MEKVKDLFVKLIDGVFWLVGVLIGMLCVATIITLMIAFIYFSVNTECLELKDGRIMCMTEQPK